MKTMAEDHLPSETTELSSGTALDQPVVDMVGEGSGTSRMEAAESAFERRLSEFVLGYGLSVREAQAVILEDMGYGQQESADILSEIHGKEFRRQNINTYLRRAHLKMNLAETEPDETEE